MLKWDQLCQKQVICAENGLFRSVVKWVICVVINELFRSEMGRLHPEQVVYAEISPFVLKMPVDHLHQEQPEVNCIESRLFISKMSHLCHEIVSYVEK